MGLCFVEFDTNLTRKYVAWHRTGIGGLHAGVRHAENENWNDPDIHNRACGFP